MYNTVDRNNCTRHIVYAWIAHIQRKRQTPRIPLLPCGPASYAFFSSTGLSTHVREARKLKNNSDSDSKQARKTLGSFLCGPRSVVHSLLQAIKAVQNRATSIKSRQTSSFSALSKHTVLPGMPIQLSKSAPLLKKFTWLSASSMTNTNNLFVEFYCALSPFSIWFVDKLFSDIWTTVRETSGQHHHYYIFSKECKTDLNFQIACGFIIEQILLIQNALDHDIPCIRFAESYTIIYIAYAAG